MRVPRQARSRETSARIVAAATRLFVSRGYPVTTMAAIAEEAGVAVQSLYLRFGGKPEILAAAFDGAVVGDDEPVSLLDRPWLADLSVCPDAVGTVRIFMAAMRELMERTYPLFAVIRSAAADETGELLERNRRQRREGLCAVAAILAGKDGFCSDLDVDSAADRLYALVSEDHFGLLVADCAWNPEAWQRWCEDLVLAALFTDTTKRRAPPR